MKTWLGTVLGLSGVVVLLGWMTAGLWLSAVAGPVGPSWYVVSPGYGEAPPIYATHTRHGHTCYYAGDALSCTR